MKIVQICGTIEGAGITRYLIEVNTALKMANHDVVAYECTYDTDYLIFQKAKRNQSLDDIKILNYSNECIEDINSADIVFVHQLIPKKATQEIKELFRDLIINKITHPKKVLFFNDHSHTALGFKKFYGGEWLEDKEFLDAFDHYCIHCNTNVYMRILKDTVGQDIAESKYVNLHHPYYMPDDVKEKWFDLSDKHKRITYIGRWHTIKNPEQMLHLNRYCIKHNKDIEFEMRGIVRLIGLIYVQGLFYKVDESKGRHKEAIIGPTEETISITSTWKKNHGYAKDDLLIDCPHEKMFIFSEYKREDGILAMAKSAFGGEFYTLKKKSDYGDNLEYAMHEIIESGTVPIFDMHMLKSVHVFKDGKRTDNTLYDENIAIGLEKDLSNIDEVIGRVEYLYSHPKEYDEMRNKAFNILKQHTDPVLTINELIENCIK